VRARDRPASRSAPRGRRCFLDRDGTLVVERGYLSDPEEIELLPGRRPFAAQAQGCGLSADRGSSNQSGVGRGLFPESRVHEAMARLRVALRARGVELDAIYFCPHRPDQGCACRKPAPRCSSARPTISSSPLRRSAMVGDKLLDVETGHNAGALGLLVRTGYGKGEEQQIPEGGNGPRPDGVFPDLSAAAEWILARGEAGDF
jgi:D-glycero-D-manno-heptose 1,7-bisphosphate phosphatase